MTRSIIELQGRIDKTAVPYGTSVQQDELRANTGDEGRGVRCPSRWTIRSSTKRRSASREIVTGGGDLLDDVRNSVRRGRRDRPGRIAGRPAGG